MTSKPKQSVAIQRQIPEHIRESYPLFVEFLKSYYDFLEQTQSQELEKIRDVDTTLEEFIDRFKSEISTGIPIELATDKRMLIKHLREFYLSRGSESSYKFLFRTLFNAEADIFYPSTQILRVSDGKWQQDVSIFVKIPDGSLPLDALNGNLINIQNGRKTFTTYAERVVQYKSNVYEIYISRDYVNELKVGATVTYTDGTNNYIGNILPCPSKVSIYKGGSGFKVGELFALKTNIGRGCVIKITKVGSIGDVKAIQVISFGLDYLTTFYSYLSSKDIIASEYIHPAQLNHPFNAAEDHYNENSGGFQDYGFASKFNESEAYMAYDTSIPVGDLAFASDRFFADPSYVGPMTQQFYADGTTKVVDETLAIIQIDLGPVAKYPGYYLQADGFISDHMYIQDGKYYQAFSYVIKVEEELRKYADIVKKILHPAGLRMYSEYSIFNVLSISATQDLIKKVLQYLDDVSVLDQGYNYDSYRIAPDAIDIEYTPSPGAGIVYSAFGKSANFASKVLVDEAIPISAPSKLFERPLSDSLNSFTDSQNKLVGKVVADAFGLSDNGYNYDAYILSIVNGVAVATPDPNSSIVYAQALQTARFAVKGLAESVINTDSTSSFLTKPLSDLFSLSDAIGKLLQKPISGDTFSLSDTYVNALNKSLSEVLVLPDEISIKEFAKDLADAIAFVEVYSNFSNKALNDSIAQSDFISSAIDRPLSDSIILDDASQLLFEKLSTDLFSLFDSSFSQLSKTVADAISAIDSRYSALDMGSIPDFIAMTDIIALSRAILQDELISLSESYANAFNKLNADSISLLDSTTYIPGKNSQDTINITTAGAIALDPYDAELYAAFEEQYQANTPIT